MLPPPPKQPPPNPPPPPDSPNFQYVQPHNHVALHVARHHRNHRLSFTQTELASHYLLPSPIKASARHPIIADKHLFSRSLHRSLYYRNDQTGENKCNKNPKSPDTTQKSPLSTTTSTSTSSNSTTQFNSPSSTHLHHHLPPSNAFLSSLSYCHPCSIPVINELIPNSTLNFTKLVIHLKSRSWNFRWLWLCIFFLVTLLHTNSIPNNTSSLGSHTFAQDSNNKADEQPWPSFS